MEKKKKKCKTCGELKYIWSRAYGCFSCSNKASQSASPPPTKKTPIKQISDKRQKQNQLYLTMRKVFLQTHEHCAVFPDKQATEIHHANGRRGDMLLDTRYWYAVSREGHLYVHENVEWAEENGYLIKGRNSI